jgi:hypothetical protein
MHQAGLLANLGIDGLDYTIQRRLKGHLAPLFEQGQIGMILIIHLAGLRIFWEKSSKPTRTWPVPSGTA